MPPAQSEKAPVMSEHARRYAFVIEAVSTSDALVRVLTVFAVQPLALASVTMVARQDGSSIRIEADGLVGRRAETLLRRLDGLAVVRSVGLGWSSPQRVAA
jgi:acetolactate synthase regulatory subunit